MSSRWSAGPGSSAAGSPAAGGVFIGIQTKVHPSMGWDLLLPLFAAAVLGGHRAALRRGRRRARHRPVPGAGDLSVVLRRSVHRAGLQAGGGVLGDGDHADLAADRAVPGAGVLMDFFSVGFLNYLIALATMSGIYAVLCLGLNLQWGFAGLFNAGIAGVLRDRRLHRRDPHHAGEPELSRRLRAADRAGLADRDDGRRARSPGRSDASACGCKATIWRWRPSASRKSSASSSRTRNG